MTRAQVLDLYFMDARCKLIELAAFLAAWIVRRGRMTLELKRCARR